jgi:hypothetical protein
LAERSAFRVACECFSECFGHQATITPSIVRSAEKP